MTNSCVNRTGSGKICASGGNGFAGGGGGRVSVDVFSRHDDPIFLVHGETCYRKFPTSFYYSKLELVLIRSIIMLFATLTL